LGFLYADGNISTTGNKLELNLSAKDLDHMLKFKEFLKFTGNIRVESNKGVGGDVCRLSVRNKHLWQQLYNKGCVPCKSLILTFPDKSIFKNSKLIRHFIRGYCDGDGSLGFYRRGVKCFCELSFIGTENFLQGILENLNVDGYLVNKSTKNYQNQAYTLKYAAYKARLVARLLYDNSNIYMDRKYNIYQKFCQYETEFSYVKSSKIGELCDENTEITFKIA
jgi:hypothetical protein